jgi:hypothetical protein
MDKPGNLCGAPYERAGPPRCTANQFFMVEEVRAFWAHEGLAAPLTVFELGTFPSATIHPPAPRDKSMLIPAPANHRLIKTG